MDKSIEEYLEKDGWVFIGKALPSPKPDPKVFSIQWFKALIKKTSVTSKKEFLWGETIFLEQSPSNVDELQITLDADERRLDVSGKIGKYG